MRPAVSLSVAVIALALVSPSQPVGDTVLTEGPTDDVFFGGADADRLDGEEGSDVLFGKAGRDRLVGGGGVDTADGGLGRDAVEAELAYDDDGRDGDAISGSLLVLAADGGRDSVECTDGGGMAFIDGHDKVAGCSIVITQSAGMIQSVVGGSIFIPTYGSDQSETIKEDPGNSIGSVLVFGRGGDDDITLVRHGIVLGGAGVDTVQGSDSFDQLVDGDGTPGDVLNGAGGFDRIFAADGALGSVDCGFADGATDTVFADPEDLLTNCGDDEVFIGTDTVVAR